MKKVILVLCLACFIAETGLAQTKTKTSHKADIETITSDPPVTLMSTAAYPAFGTASENRLQIADPLIKTLNLNAAGANIEVSSSGVIGMPKVSYGIANGKLLLRTTTAPTIGSFTGTGSVGTGTALGSIGTGGNGLGVNGKNPDAGPALYGVPVYGTTVIRNKTDLKQ